MARGLRSQSLASQAVLLPLTAMAVLTQGFHPLAEDGGLYAAGVEASLDPTLFPYERAFALQHTTWNLFAPLLAGSTRLLHVSLTSTLLLYYTLTLWLLLFSAWRLARVAGFGQSASLAAAALVAAWASLPIAGTSLSLMDPYVTTRSFSTPLTLLAFSFVMQACERRPRACGSSAPRYAAAAMFTLLLAAAMHPLMAGYGAILCALVWSFARSHRSLYLAVASLLGGIAVAASVQHGAPFCGTACTIAAHSRDYWFPSQWRWFEWIGLAAPLLFCWFGLRLAQRHCVRAMLQACLCLGCTATLVALLFCRWNNTNFAVARLQPLRAFLPVYAVFLVGLAATVADALLLTWRHSPRLRLTVALGTLCLLFGISALIQNRTYAHSAHLELLDGPPENGWAQAFVWLRQNTPADAVVALDANYAALPGEEAQNARAWSRRSTLPDSAKDGGAAADVAALAPEWLAAVNAQHNLNVLPDAQRLRRLAPWQVGWLVLTADASTGFHCPYRNSAVKVCRLPDSPSAPS